MFDTGRMFKDVERMIQRFIRDQTPLSDGMRLWLDYCEGRLRSKAWTALRKLDFEADYDRLTYWLFKLLVDEPPPSKINGLWFGLFNPCLERGIASCQMYLAGSKRFDPKRTTEWQCNPEYWPKGRYSSSEVLDRIYRHCEKLPADARILGEGALCHGYVGLLLARWCRGPMRFSLLGPAKYRAVAFGHDEGDVHSVAVLHYKDRI